MKIAINLIRPDPGQPRRTFDPEELRALAASIKQNGLIQPIAVRRAPRQGAKQGYIIVAGERRWRAHRILLAGGSRMHRTIEAVVVDGKDAKEILVAQIIENLQRAETPPMEEADALARLRDDYGMAPDAIADKLGLAPFRVAWRLRLLNLDPDIRRLVEAEHIDRQTAMEVARLDDRGAQRRIVQAVNRRELVGWKAVRTAVDSILGVAGTIDLFGAGVSKSEQLETVRSMEARIERVITFVGAGWREGECVIASMVDPGRARAMAEKLALLRRTLTTMERELHNVAAQASFTLEPT